MTYEGDIIRPLGLVTLYFGYAEVEVDELICSLMAVDHLDGRKRQWSVGRKLGYAQELVAGLNTDRLDGLREILDEAAELFDRRNALVHSAIFSGTQYVTSRASGVAQPVSSDALTELAQEIFNCKERINVSRQRVLEPWLATLA